MTREEQSGKKRDHDKTRETPLSRDQETVGHSFGYHRVVRHRRCIGTTTVLGISATSDLMKGRAIGEDNESNSAQSSQLGSCRE